MAYFDVRIYNKRHRVEGIKRGYFGIDNIDREKLRQGLSTDKCNQWRVTHLPSGLALVDITFDTLEDAEFFVGCLLELEGVDWTAQFDFDTSPMYAFYKFTKAITNEHFKDKPDEFLKYLIMLGTSIKDGKHKEGVLHEVTEV